MNKKNINIAFGITGSFYTFQSTVLEIKKIVDKGGNVYPIMSKSAFTIDTKYGKAKDFVNKIEEITNKKIIKNISDAEEINADIMVVAPCSRK